jgi:hypothetical protein
MPPQAAGMSRYPVAEEIMPGRADYLVVDAVRRNGSPMGDSLSTGKKQGNFIKSGSYRGSWP